MKNRYCDIVKDGKIISKNPFQIPNFVVLKTLEQLKEELIVEYNLDIVKHSSSFESLAKQESMFKPYFIQGFKSDRTLKVDWLLDLVVDNTPKNIGLINIPLMWVDYYYSEDI